MRSENRHSMPYPEPTRWRQFADFVVHRRLRILLTIALALSADYWGGRIVQHNLAEVQDPKALLGLAWVLSGCTLLAWAAGSKGDPIQSKRNGVYALLGNPLYVGLFLATLGLCLLIDNPKNIWLLLGPVILLDLIRLRREDFLTFQQLGSPRGANEWTTTTGVPSWAGIAKSIVVARIAQLSASITRPPQRSLSDKQLRQAQWLLRSRSYAPVLIVPIVAFAVIVYAWPFDSLQFHETWEIRCLLVSFVGLAIRMLASGSLPGDSPRPARIRKVMALNTDGVFSVVRHPRYLGDYAIGLGVVSIPFVWWLPVIYSLAFWFYYKRFILLEERELRQKFGKRFDEWALVTPALIPRFSRWRPLCNPFSLRMALKREHAGLFVVIALHSSIEWLEHLILDRRVMLEVFWIVLGLTGLTAYVLVRHLAKHTRILNVPAG